MSGFVHFGTACRRRIPADIPSIVESALKSGSLILLLLLVFLPLAALTWAGLRMVESEAVVVEKNFRRLMLERLSDVNDDISEYLSQLEQELNRTLTETSFDTAQLRQRARTEPRILQLFVLQHDGRLQHPDPTSPLTEDERTFLLQAAKMFTGQDLHDSVLRSEQRRSNSATPPKALSVLPSAPSSRGTDADASAANRSASPPPKSPRRAGRPEPTAESSLEVDHPAQSQQAEPAQELIRNTYGQAPVRNLKSFAAGSGWFTWYWDRGLNLIYWQRRPSGHIVGCALERARWMADLIAKLPETMPTVDSPHSAVEARVRLVNSSAALVYQWGLHEPAGDAVPLCEVPLPAPLASWRLQCFVPLEELLAGSGRSARLSLLTSLLVLGLVVATILVLLIREYRRDMRAAEQQVSFVNQVSHELKTPLTNIRMYAEMLEQDLEDLQPDQIERPRQRLDVILSEGQRLSRLIGNVLTFARQKRRSLQPQPVQVNADELIQTIVNRFRPALQDLQIETELNLTVERSMSVDPDFLEQILGNLISNVEKYAADGGLLRITSQCVQDRLQVDVSDCGPGIPAESREEVFQPFARISNDLHYAAGTGIGLPIARELAQLHGGDVLVVPGQSGCTFRLTLQEL